MRDTADFALTDDELRSTGRLKWSVYPDDVLPAWVADMDVRPSAAVVEALHAAVAQGRTTYAGPTHRTGLPEVFGAFQAGRHGWEVDPGRVVLVGDVVGGLELALRTLCEDGPIAIPVPNYGPFFDLARHVGRKVAPVRHRIDDLGRATLDLDDLEGAFAAGARTLLVSQPQNPLGRAFDRDELAGWISLARRHGARILSDEIWGSLTLEPNGYVPMASLAGSEGCVTAVTSSAKVWNLAGLKSAVVVTTSAADARALTRAPIVANHGQSSLGIAAALAAYAEGGEWLDSALDQLRVTREHLARLVAVRLPGVTLHPPEATFLAWLDTSALDLADPVGRAREIGRVALSPGNYFDPENDPGHAGHVRLNFGTSLERLERIVAGLERAWYA